MITHRTSYCAEYKAGRPVQNCKQDREERATPCCGMYFKFFLVSGRHQHEDVIEQHSWGLNTLTSKSGWSGVGYGNNLGTEDLQSFTTAAECIER